LSSCAKSVRADKTKKCDRNYRWKVRTNSGTLDAITLRTGSRPEPRHARIGGIAAVVLSALLGGLIATPNARADGDAGAAVPAAPAAAEQPQGTLIPAPAPPETSPPADQAVATGQDAAADAVAAQPKQPNVVVVVRINSPGDDVIAQTNTVTVDSSASNRSATMQADAPAAALLLSRPINVARAARPAARQQPPPSTPAAVASAPSEPAAAPRSAAPQRPTPAAQRHSAAAPRRTAAPRQPLQRARSVTAPTPRPSHETQEAGGQRPATTASSPSVPQQASAPGTGIARRLLALAEPLRQARAPLSAPAGVSSSGDSDFTLAALAVLAIGLLGWAALAWLPRRRPSPWSARG
jgi:hypothetical protein